jgi:hypothetical protein
MPAASCAPLTDLGPSDIIRPLMGYTAHRLMRCFHRVPLPPGNRPCNRGVYLQTLLAESALKRGRLPARRMLHATPTRAKCGSFGAATPVADFPPPTSYEDFFRQPTATTQVSIVFPGRSRPINDNTLIGATGSSMTNARHRLRDPYKPLHFEGRVRGPHMPEGEKSTMTSPRRSRDRCIPSSWPCCTDILPTSGRTLS